MRNTARALVGALFVACCSQQLTAAEAKSKWWPFGNRDETTIAQPPAVAVPSAPTGRMPGTTGPTATSGVAAPQAPLPPSAAPTTPEQNWMVDSPRKRISWPTLRMPEMPKPPMPRFGQANDQAPAAARNSWTDTTPIAPKPSPLQSVKNGAAKVGTGTRNAWHKTVDVFTPGESESARSGRVAKREIQPPLWKRMFGAKSELQGPQTVPEWMAQQRLDP